jgi:glycosyltransferase involved in cell wall biosynthesis
MTNVEIAVAAPAYNEAAGLERVVGHWLEYLRGHKEVARFEIVVCNDGSRDGTGYFLDRAAAAAAEIRPVHHERNEGAAAALATAIGRTTADWVLLLDADGQFPIENLDRVVSLLDQAGARAFIGVRSRKRGSAFERFGMWASGLLANLFHGTRLRDFNCAFKVVHGPLLRSLVLEAKGLNYSTEITSRLVECGVTLHEVEIEHAARGWGRSSATSWRSVVHRALFVLYLGVRQLLLRWGVLRRARR